MATPTERANRNYRLAKASQQAEVPTKPSDQFILIDQKGNRVHIDGKDLRKRIIKGRATPSDEVFDFAQEEWIRAGDLAMPREVIVRDIYIPYGSVGRLVFQAFVVSIPIYFILGLIWAMIMSV